MTDQTPPFVQTLPVGSTFYRCYRSQVSATQYTQSTLQQPAWRFTPFPDQQGQTVQGLYMSDSAMGAISETVFRKNIAAAVLLNEVKERHICQLSSQRPLNIALLTSAFLEERLGYNPIASNDYPRCNDIARLLYHLKQPKLDGIAFASYQSGGHNKNIVVFSQRTQPDDFAIVPHSAEAVLSQRYIADFLLAAQASQRLLSEALIKQCQSLSLV